MIRQVRRYLQESEDGIPLGYSCSGIVDGVGDEVKGLKTGLRVACYGAPYVYHAEMLSVPENLVIELPKKVNFEEGAFTGIGAIAIHAFHQSGVGLGEVVAVFGAGLLGNMVGQVCRAAGVKVVMVDSQEGRLQKARNVGIAHTAKPGVDGLTRLVAQQTEGLGVDASFICCDAEDSVVSEAVDVLRERGRMIVVGGGDLRLPREALYFKEAEVRMARAGGPGRYDPAFERDGHPYPPSYVRWTERENMKLFAELLSERKAQLAPLVTDRVPLERAASAYDKLLRGLESCYAVTLTV